MKDKIIVQDRQWTFLITSPRWAKWAPKGSKFKGQPECVADHDQLYGASLCLHQVNKIVSLN